MRYVREEKERGEVTRKLMGEREKQVASPKDNIYKNHFNFDRKLFLPIISSVLAVTTFGNLMDSYL